MRQTNGSRARILAIVGSLAGLLAAGAANATYSFLSGTATITSATFNSPVAVASPTQTITFKSTTAAYKVYLLSNSTAFKITAPATGACGIASTSTVSVAANGSCSVNVSYTPTSSAAASGVITAYASATAAGTAAAVSPTLAVTGTSNMLQLRNGTTAITTYAFPVTSAGATSTLAVTVANLSTTAALSGVTVTVSGAGFTQASTCAATLAASGTCVSNLTFAPTAAGAFTGTLTVSSTSSTSATLALTGTATAAIPAWETTNTLGTGTAMFMAGPPMRYATTTGVPGCNSPTGGFVHTAQGGDICAFASTNYAFSYDSSQTGTAYGDYYIYQAAAGAAYAPATDYFGISVLAPYANANSAITPVAIPNSAAMLIRLGNQVTASATNGTARTFTVTMKNQALNGTWPATNPAACTVDVVLLTPATGTATGPGNATFTGSYLGQASGTYVAALGLLDYSIPFTAFTCATNDGGTGAATTIAALKATGVTQVAVSVVGSKNPAVVATSIDAISLGGISFQ